MEETNKYQLVLENNQIEEVSKFKYLGIIIDNKFTSHDHILYTAEKCTKLINALPKSAKLVWSLKYGALRTIFTGANLPLSYAASIWSKALESPKHSELNPTRLCVF